MSTSPCIQCGKLFVVAAASGNLTCSAACYAAFMRAPQTASRARAAAAPSASAASSAMQIDDGDDDAPWRCSHCSFENEGIVILCRACHALHPAAAAARAAEEEAAMAAEQEEATFAAVAADVEASGVDIFMRAWSTEANAGAPPKKRRRRQSSDFDQDKQAAAQLQREEEEEAAAASSSAGASSSVAAAAAPAASSTRALRRSTVANSADSAARAAHAGDDEQKGADDDGDDEWQGDEEDDNDAAAPARSARASAGASAAGRAAGELAEEIGIFGHACFRQLINNFSEDKFFCLNTLQHCRWDCWLTVMPETGAPTPGVMRALGIPIQVKSRLATSGKWITDSKGVHGVPWTAYQGGSLAHVVLSPGNHKLMKDAVRDGEPLPRLTREQHLENEYSMIAFNRGEGRDGELQYSDEPRVVDGVHEFAITLKPGIATGYRIPSETYAARFQHLTTCWRLQPDADGDLTRGVLSTLDAVWADRFKQFKRMTFVDCEHIAGITNVKEHFSVKMTQVILQGTNIGDVRVCQTGAPADAIVLNCPVEFECAVNDTSHRWLGNMRDKDWRNLKSGRVRMIISTRLHWDPADFTSLPDDHPKKNEHLVIYALPWLAVLPEAEARKKGYTGEMYTLAEAESQSELACKPFRMSLLDEGKREWLHDMLHQCRMPLDDIPRFLHTHHLSLSNHEYLYPSVGLNEHKDDISRDDDIAPAILRLVAKGWAFSEANLKKFSDYPREWPYKMRDKKNPKRLVPYVMDLSDASQENLTQQADALRSKTGWPKNKDAYCPAIPQAGDKSVEFLPGDTEKHRHTSSDSMAACLSHGLNAKPSQFGTKKRPHPAQHRHPGTQTLWFRHAQGKYGKMTL